MTVLDAFEMFLADITNVQRQQRSTIRAHRSIMRLLIETSPETTHLEDLTHDVLLRFFNWGTRERRWSAVTLDTHHRRLHCFLAWAVREGHVASNPMDTIAKPKLPRRTLRSLRQNQAIQVLEAASLIGGATTFARVRSTAIMAIFLFAGLRKSELLDLAVPDVDLVNNVITVLEGKGGKDRHVPISPTLAGYLLPYVDARTRANRSTWAFIASETRDTPLAESTLRRLVRQIEEEVGFKFGPHMLRHTFATLMMEGGCDIYALSEMMGHSDIRTTTIYLSNTVEHLRAQVALNPLGAQTAPTTTAPTRWLRRNPRLPGVLSARLR